MRPKPEGTTGDRRVPHFHTIHILNVVGCTRHRHTRIFVNGKTTCWDHAALKTGGGWTTVIHNPKSAQNHPTTFKKNQKQSNLILNHLNISGWWFEPLWKILVSWDDYSHYMEGHRIHVPNHQSSTTFPSSPASKLVPLEGLRWSQASSPKSTTASSSKTSLCGCGDGGNGMVFHIKWCISWTSIYIYTHIMNIKFVVSYIIFIHIHTYIHACMHTYIYIYIHFYLYTCIYIYIYICFRYTMIYMCIHQNINISVYVSIHYCQILSVPDIRMIDVDVYMYMILKRDLGLEYVDSNIRRIQTRQRCGHLEGIKLIVLWSPTFNLWMICRHHDTVSVVGIPVLQCAFKAKTNRICPIKVLGVIAIKYWQILHLPVLSCHAISIWPEVLTASRHPITSRRWNKYILFIFLISLFHGKSTRLFRVDIIWNCD